MDSDRFMVLRWFDTSAFIALWCTLSQYSRLMNGFLTHLSRWAWILASVPLSSSWTISLSDWQYGSKRLVRSLCFADADLLGSCRFRYLARSAAGGLVRTVTAFAYLVGVARGVLVDAGFESDCLSRTATDTLGVGFLRLGALAWCCCLRRRVFANTEDTTFSVFFAFVCAFAFVFVFRVCFRLFAFTAVLLRVWVR